MATKTITIDVEAYERLKAVQQPNESFSTTIKRVVRAPLDVRTFAQALSHPPMNRQAIRAIEEHMNRRHQPTLRRR